MPGDLGHRHRALGLLAGHHHLHPALDPPARGGAGAPGGDIQRSVGEIRARSGAAPGFLSRGGAGCASSSYTGLPGSLLVVRPYAAFHRLSPRTARAPGGGGWGRVAGGGGVYTSHYAIETGEGGAPPPRQSHPQWRYSHGPLHRTINRLTGSSHQRKATAFFTTTAPLQSVASTGRTPTVPSLPAAS